jgi:hypothetical protein
VLVPLVVLDPLLVDPVVPEVVPVVPVALVPLGLLGVVPEADADALSSVPVISTLWPTCPLSLSSSVVLSLYVALAAMLLGVVELAPAVEPLVEPDGDVLPEGEVVVDEVEPDGDVAVDEVEPLPIDEPAGLIAALVSVQLSSEPCRQPVTVTVLAEAVVLVLGRVVLGL